MNKQPRIYLAGPGVFRADAAAYSDKLKALASSFGMVGMWPCDQDPVGFGMSSLKAYSICQFNKSMIDECDGLVADISPFRGRNMDPGTAYEIGRADALGKPIFCYSNDLRTLADRTKSITVATGYSFDRSWTDFPIIEDFGLQENLMISCSVRGVYRSAEEALRAAAEYFAEKKAVPA